MAGGDRPKRGGGGGNRAVSRVWVAKSAPSAEPEGNSRENVVQAASLGPEAGAAANRERHPLGDRYPLLFLVRAWELAGSPLRRAPANAPRWTQEEEPASERERTRRKRAGKAKAALDLTSSLEVEAEPRLMNASAPEFQMPGEGANAKTLRAEAPVFEPSVGTVAEEHIFVSSDPYLHGADPSAMDINQLQSWGYPYQIGDLSTTASSQSSTKSPAQTPMDATRAVIVEQQVRQQVEHYFSVNNLIRDHFLRSLMDHEGWVCLENIVQFPRVSRLCVDVKRAAATLVGSSVVEVSWDSPPRARLKDPDSRKNFPRVEARPVALDALLPQAKEGAGGNTKVKKNRRPQHHPKSQKVLPTAS